MGLYVKITHYYPVGIELNYQAIILRGKIDRVCPRLP
jgi:hypothetical protein